MESFVSPNSDFVQAKEIMGDLSKGKSIQHPYIGVMMVTITPEFAQQYNADPNTGTPIPEGKSLSVLCSSLQWLADQTRKDFERTAEPNSSNTSKIDNDDKRGSGLPDWLTGYTEQKQKSVQEKEIERRREQEEKLNKRLEDVRRGLDPRTQGTTQATWRRTQNKKRKLELLPSESKAENNNSLDPKPSTGDEDPNALEEYHSDGEIRPKASFSDESDEDEEERKLEEKEEDEFEARKILYCSRTHSQTAQFIRELRKTAYADTRVLALGSRRLLCVNPEVKHLPSDAQINDRCQDLLDKKQKKKEKLAKEDNKKKRNKDKKGTSGCPFLNQASQDLFKDQVLATARDIEELAKLGEDSETCAYYGSRKAVSLAQLVVMPYSMLLLKSAREQMGIKLKGNVVIVDEAHNLIEAINSINGSTVTLAELQRAHCQLSQYHARYASRLKGKNLAYVNQILYLIRSLLKFLEAGCKIVASRSQSSAMLEHPKCYL